MLLVLVLQLLAPHLPLDYLARRFVTRTYYNTHARTAASPSLNFCASPSARLFDSVTPSTCPRPKQQSEFGTSFSFRHTERRRNYLNMGIAEHAKRVAAEFEFGPDAVRKAVKEFIREMGT